ncbi:NADPH-dependent glutamate synthase [Zhaonella formicivorans]|uniref:NADPH-dependent glutamate synthase n=1 Tax=Zhaonella formicivorans TaxID=2528593 RepID=UPI0010DA5907|nr:NADPH-dependent glutamate synthase [Zhaonella formicivorans]
MPLNLDRTPMPAQEASERIKNFKEVALGFDADMAVKEAERCIQCKKPGCVQGCPVNVDIPDFIKLITQKDFIGAAQKIKEKNNLPAICGRVCPQENQCEKLCVLAKKGAPVGIGRLERFAADFQLNEKVEVPEIPPSSGFKVAVIGAGPAGLTCAADLAKMGHKVTVFEALHVPGGVLMYGIPEFRLPKKIVEAEIDYIKKLGVDIQVNSVVGKMNTVDELLEEGYDAVFIGTGAGLPYFMNIPGENFNGVYSANEFLTRTNLMKAYDFPNSPTPIKVGKKVAVIGAGNVAMDAARTALRLGAEESYIVYRRSKEEIPARHEELEHALEEGVQLKLLTSPVEIHGNEEGWVTGMTCIRYELGEPDASGRRKPVPVEGSEYFMEVDTVVMAIGQGPNPLVLNTTPGLELNKKGNIVADEKGQTSKPGVFAGGDIVTGAATVILAMGAGKKAAQAIDEYLKTLKK